jgi:hypothetical protein
MNCLPGAGFEPQILLISTSWVARITGVSHQCPAFLHLLQVLPSAPSCVSVFGVVLPSIREEEVVAPSAHPQPTWVEFSPIPAQTPNCICLGQH